MLTAAKNFLLIYFLLEPFYLFHSGTIQPSDIFIILSAICFLIHAKLNIYSRQELRSILRENRLLIIFVTCTFLINTVYFLLIPQLKFILSSLYFVFNFLAIIVFTVLAEDKVFLSRISGIFKFNLFVQLIVYLTGIGRFYTADRYMGTFNDPNQFGFYIFISLLFLFMIEIVLRRNKKNIAYWLIGIFLIVQSASTGMLLGLTAFTMLLLIYNLKNFKFTYTKLRKIMLGILGMIIISLGLLGIYLYIQSTVSSPSLQNGTAESSQEGMAIIDRTNTKFSKAEGDSSISIWEDRGYDILYKYPEYLPLGAGEGGYDRYDKAANNYGNEVHATLPSILFYYGIIPFLFFLAWLYRKLKGSDPRAKIAIIALLIESFTLLNQRQPLFWMLILLAAFASDHILSAKASIEGRNVHKREDKL